MKGKRYCRGGRNSVGKILYPATLSATPDNHFSIVPNIFQSLFYQINRISADHNLKSAGFDNSLQFTVDQQKFLQSNFESHSFCLPRFN